MFRNELHHHRSFHTPHRECEGLGVPGSLSCLWRQIEYWKDQVARWNSQSNFGQAVPDYYRPLPEWLFFYRNRRQCFFKTPAGSIIGNGSYILHWCWWVVATHTLTITIVDQVHMVYVSVISWSVRVTLQEVYPTQRLYSEFHCSMRSVANRLMVRVRTFDDAQL